MGANLPHMARKNTLTQAPPYAVERAIRQLGANLRTARLRRNLTISEVAEKIGTGPRAVADAEKGKLTSGINVYVALLWALDMLAPWEQLANPYTDEAGLIQAAQKQRARAKLPGLDSAF